MAQHNMLEQENLALKKELIKVQYLLKDFERRSGFFEMLIKSLPGIFYLVDESLEFQRWNGNLERVTGYSSAELEGRSSLMVFDGEDSRKIREGLRRAFDTGEATEEAELITKSGARIPYLFTGVSAKIQDKFYLVGMGADLSERKRGEDALRESEELYRTLTERMTIGVTLCHRSRIVSANNAFVSMFGYEDSSQLLGKDVMSLVPEGFQKYIREMFEEIETDASTERFFETRWLTKTGQEFWIEGRAEHIRWKGLPTVLLTARDITEAKEREISMGKETESLRRENVNLRSSIKDRYRLGRIIGKSPAMQEVYELILNAAATSANVIIYGESGTGKELVAGAIHEMSSRSGKAFAPVNCAAIPENLLESEFFGHKKGAFSGAHIDKQGYLDAVDGGTLFLDEIDMLTPTLQAKLLRAIEGGGYSAVGSTVTKSSDFRIIGATNSENLMEHRNEGAMRKDFFYRIHIIPIHVPPLRHRKEDIPLLVEHFLKHYSEDERILSLPGHMLQTFMNYDWPGNVRELQNVIQRYLAVERFELPSASVPGSQDSRVKPQPETGIAGQAPLLRANLEGTEKASIRDALDRCQGKKARAAAALGISRMTLYRKMKRLELA